MFQQLMEDCRYINSGLFTDTNFCIIRPIRVGMFVVVIVGEAYKSCNIQSFMLCRYELHYLPCLK